MLESELPCPEAAIRKSPLQRLPPEIRGIIYRCLLVQQHEILVSYKRFRPPLRNLALFPYVCMLCGGNISRCKCKHFTLKNEFYYQHQPLPPLSVTTGILSTCQLIYDEAARYLYKDNV